MKDWREWARRGLDKGVKFSPSGSGKMSSQTANCQQDPSKLKTKSA